MKEIECTHIVWTGSKQKMEQDKEMFYHIIFNIKMDELIREIKGQEKQKK